MCVVMDANQAANFCSQNQPHLTQLMAWINRGGKIAVGGKLEVELFRIHAMRNLIGEWSKSGRLRRVSKEIIEKKELELKGKCISNDVHVIALAIISKASIVVTEDKELISDIGNKKIMKYNCRVYKKNEKSPNNIGVHKKMLRSSDCP